MANRSLFALLLLVFVARAAPGTAPSASCDACLFSWRMLEDVLDDPDVVQTAVSFVEARCPSFGPAASDKCKALAEGLLPAVAEWLASPTTARQFCDCGATPAPLQKPVRDVDATCALCQLVVDQVQTVINQTGVFDKINATAQQACAQLPAEMAAYCSSFVNQYESLLEDLVTKAPPEEVCELLGVCAPQLVARLSTAKFTRALDTTTTTTTTTTRTRTQWWGGARGAGCPNKLIRSVQLARLSAAPGVPRGALGDSCDYCKMAVIEAHSLIGNPAVQQSILNYTHTLCDTFQSWNQTCDLYVDAYAPLAFSTLQQYLVPDTLCAEVGACPSAALTTLDGPATPSPGLFAAVVDALLQAMGLRVPRDDEALEGQRGPVRRMKL